MNRRLIAGTINRYQPEPGWDNIHMDASNRRLADGTQPEVIASFTQIPLDAESFEEVRCWESLEHLRLPDAQQALREFHRILKPGGILDLTVPDVPELVSQLLAGSLSFHDFLLNIYGDQTAIEDAHLLSHRWGWSAETLAADLADAGFTPGEPLTDARLHFRAARA